MCQWAFKSEPPGQCASKIELARLYIAIMCDSKAGIEYNSTHLFVLDMVNAAIGNVKDDVQNPLIALKPSEIQYRQHHFF